MAYDRLKGSLTKGNLWLYVLSSLEKGGATPGELINMVGEEYGFSPARITFYSVLYKLRRQGLVRKSSEKFRSSYEITDLGRSEMARARELIDRLGSQLGKA